MKHRVKSSAEEKEIAEKYCQELCQLTGLNFFVVMPEVHVALMCDRKIFGYWQSWKDARKAIVACLLVVKFVRGQDCSSGFCKDPQQLKGILAQPMDEEFQGQLAVESEILQQAIWHILKQRFEDELK